MMRWFTILCVLISAAACGDAPEFDRNALDDLRRRQGPQDPYYDGGPNPLRVVVMDVGQGDAILVISPEGDTALIDAGPPGAGSDIIIPLLESEGIDTLSCIIATHYHSDHIGGLLEVLSGKDGVQGTEDDIVPETALYDRGGEMGAEDQHLYPLYRAAAENFRETALPGDHIQLGSAKLEIVAANGLLADKMYLDIGDPPDENAASIAAVMEYGEFRMFLGGDITGGGGTPPYDTPDLETPLSTSIGDIDVLKVSHHGSQTSTNEAFLQNTTPEVAIISTGDDNAFFHSHASVIERLEKYGISTYQTERGWADSSWPNVIGGHIAIEAENDGTYRIIVP